MRILFLNGHPVWTYGLPWGFRRLGHNVQIVDAIQQDDLIRRMRTFQPDLMVSVGWIDQYTPEKLAVTRYAARHFGCPHVYWATEDINHLEKWSLPLVKAVEPDAVFTINADCIPVYRDLGIPAFHLEFGYNPEFDSADTQPGPGYAHDISLVANTYAGIWSDAGGSFRRRSVETVVGPLVETGYDLALWGKGWEQIFGPGPKPGTTNRYFPGLIFLGLGRLQLGYKQGRNPIIGYPFLTQCSPLPVAHVNIQGAIPFADTFHVYKNTKINLNLQNENRFSTQVTSRTFEILGCGGFQLTMRTPAVERLFTHGRHLVMSASPAETVELVDYYLAHEEERRAIAAAGRAAVLAAHTYDKRAAYMLACLESAIDQADGKKSGPPSPMFTSTGARN